jgi:DNA-binding transcriptional MerR regulator
MAEVNGTDRDLLMGEAAQLIGCQAWMLLRLFARGFAPPPRRVGRYRVVRESDLESLKKALVEHGYLKREHP